MVVLLKRVGTIPVDTSKVKGMKKQSIDVKESLLHLQREANGHAHLSRYIFGMEKHLMEAVCFQKIAEMSEFSVDSFYWKPVCISLSKHGNWRESLPDRILSFFLSGCRALLGWGDENGDEVVTGREVSEYINTIISSAVPSRSQGSQMITNDDTIMLGIFTGKSISAGPDRGTQSLPQSKRERRSWSKYTSLGNG